MQAAPQVAPPLGQPVNIFHQHLDLVTNKDGICQRFYAECPDTITELPDWIMKLRSAVKNAKSGVRWKSMVNLVPGQPAQAVNQVVPFVAVFDMFFSYWNLLA